MPTWRGFGSPAGRGGYGRVTAAYGLGGWFAGQEGDQVEDHGRGGDRGDLPVVVGRGGLDRAAHAEIVDVAGPDGPEAEPLVVIEVAAAVDRAADADVDRVVLDQQVLLEGPPEDRAVGGRGVEVGVPGIQVRVEVHQRDLAVLADDRAQHRQRDRVVAANGDDLPAAVHQIARVPGDLLHRRVDRERGDRHVPRIDDLDLAERGAVQLDVVARPQVPRGL